MIKAINGAGLGFTATFATAAQAGTQAVAAAGAGHGTDTGIEINGPGAGVGKGTTPGAVGTLAPAELVQDAQTDVLCGTSQPQECRRREHHAYPRPGRHNRHHGQSGDYPGQRRVHSRQAVLTATSGISGDYHGKTALNRQSLQLPLLTPPLGPARLPTPPGHITPSVSQTPEAEPRSPDIADVRHRAEAAAGSTFTADTNSDGRHRDHQLLRQRRPEPERYRSVQPGRCANRR